MKKSSKNFIVLWPKKKQLKSHGWRGKLKSSKITISGLFLSAVILAVLFVPAVFSASFGTDLGSFNGVTAFSNGSSGYYSGLSNTVTGIYTGIKWQCVEYIRRYYLLVYGMNLGSLYRGNANTWYDNAGTMGLNRYPNGGTTAPQVGDIITSNGGSYGHIAIIKSVTANQVCTIQQNFSNDTNDTNRCLTLTVSGGTYTISGFSSSYPIRGWLRKPGSTPPPACSGGTSENYRINGGPPLHSNGSLIIERNTSTVYVLQNGQKRPISSPDVLHHLYTGENGEFDFSDVITVASDEISRYPVGAGVFDSLPSNGRSQPDGRLIKQVGGGEISIVTNNGKRRPFALESVFLGLGYLYCGVVEVSDYNSYPVESIVNGLEALPTVTSSITLQPSGPYSVGQFITASFSITNKGNTSVTYTQLLAGGRLNGSTIADFPADTNITITPNSSYNYSKGRSFSNAGNYQFFPAIQSQDGIWRISLLDEIGVAPGINSIISTTINNITAPSAPTASSATSVTSNSFSANWGNSGGTTGYRLDVSTSSSFGSYVSGYQDLDVGNVNSRSVSGLSAGTTYYYRVRAYNAGGTSSNSNVISVITTGNNIQVMVQTNPSGRSFTVDSTTYASTQTFNWTSGSSHTISTTSPQSGGTGTQFVWSNWSDSGAISHTVSPTTSTTYTANFSTQYQLTMSANPSNGGTVSPTNGNWYNAGQNVSISAAPNSGNTFGSWTGTGAGSYTGTNNPANVTMNGPISETANFNGVLIRKATCDFDGDNKTDLSVFRPSDGVWWINRSSTNQVFAAQFGNNSDKLAPGDFTGDGKNDIALWRPASGEWFILRSEDFSFFAFPFGSNGDVPVPADFDGDGKYDAAVFRPSNSTWFIRRSTDTGVTIQSFGLAGDVPVPSDYDGDGKADIAIYRPSVGQWWLNRSTAGIVAITFGNSTDKAVQGDYTGDGKTDVAIWRPSTGEWFILRSEDFSFYAVPFGISTDLPTPGDYDGDGKYDTAVFRPSNSTWFVNRTTAGILIQTFGIAGDRPVPNAFVP